jgi:hypothetical protein
MAKLNACLLVAYIANTVITFGSQLGWFGATNQQQSLKYQTLVTPAGFAFAIWGPIFLLQGAFSIVQLLPKFRSDPAVTAGGYYYVAACVAQAGWTVAFSQDVIWLSLVCMLLILASLALLCRSLVRVATEQPPDAMRYTLLYAPFLLHFGWICAAATVNASVVAVKYAPTSHELHLGVAIASLALLPLPALYNPLTSAGAPPTADPLYTSAIAWAIFGVSRELTKSPLEGKDLPNWCPPLVSHALSGVALGLAALLGVVVVARAGATLVKKARRALTGAAISDEAFLSVEGK